MNELYQTLAQQAKETADKNRELVETPSTRVQWLNTFAETLIELTVLKTLEQQKILKEGGITTFMDLEANTKLYFSLPT
jgi:hypothetical protein